MGWKVKMVGYNINFFPSPHPLPSLPSDVGFTLPALRLILAFHPPVPSPVLRISPWTFTFTFSLPSPLISPSLFYSFPPSAPLWLVARMTIKLALFVEKFDGISVIPEINYSTHVQVQSLFHNHYKPITRVFSNMQQYLRRKIRENHQDAKKPRLLEITVNTSNRVLVSIHIYIHLWTTHGIHNIARSYTFLITYQNQHIMIFKVIIINSLFHS